MSKEHYFLSIAKVVASRSKCLSRKIGAVLVRDDFIISTGYNGPPRGVPHCLFPRLKQDKFLQSRMPEVPISFLAKDRCPREICGFSSGEGLELCPAVHAEVNAIVQAARAGVSTEGSTLYLTCGVPCKNCLGAIINAGISKVYVTSNDLYDPCSKFMLEHCNVEIIVYPSK